MLKRIHLCIWMCYIDSCQRRDCERVLVGMVERLSTGRGKGALRGVSKCGVLCQYLSHKSRRLPSHCIGNALVTVSVVTSPPVCISPAKTIGWDGFQKVHVGSVYLIMRCVRFGNHVTQLLCGHKYLCYVSTVLQGLSISLLWWGMYESGPISCFTLCSREYCDILPRSVSLCLWSVHRSSSCSWELCFAWRAQWTRFAIWRMASMPAWTSVSDIASHWACNPVCWIAWLSVIWEQALGSVPAAICMSLSVVDAEDSVWGSVHNGKVLTNRWLPTCVKYILHVIEIISREPSAMTTVTW